MIKFWQEKKLASATLAIYYILCVCAWLVGGVHETKAVRSHQYTD